MAKKREQTRHTDAAFNKQEREDFFVGNPVGCRSDNILWASWGEGGLICMYSTGPYTYPCSRHQAEAFASAPSKMGFIHDEYLSRGVRGTKG